MKTEHVHKWKVNPAIRNRIAVVCQTCGKKNSDQNKYKNKKVTIDGIEFDSTKEAQYYLVYKTDLKNKKIKRLILQPTFELIPEILGVIRPITYRGDFMLEHFDGTTEVIDVKGVRTEVFNLKRKLLLWKFHTEPKYKNYRFTIV